MVKSLLVVEPPKNAEAASPMPVQDREEVWLTPRAAKLKEIQAIEGDEFSQEKYDLYRHRKAGGIVLTVVGFPVLLVTSLVFALSADPGSWVDTNDKEPPRSDAQEVYRGVAWATLVTSFVSLCVGVPLAISGAHGKRRQAYLRRNYQIPAPIAFEADLRGVGFTFQM
jgi:ABC-type Fe3+ transport system permease subunit